jgi:glucose-6-phosphate 1-dehydrogenase
MNAARSDAIVFYGATGDLAYKQIFPLRPFERPTPVEVNLPSRLPCVGTGRCEGCARATPPR